MTSPEHRLWGIAHSLTEDSRVTHSTMMGLPCLRWNGAFFACLDSRTGDLVIKLSKARVDELIAAREARPFAPAGRPFKQWAAISVARQHVWPGMLTEAHRFVAAQTPSG